jgi:hypothetical protein
MTTQDVQHLPETFICEQNNKRYRIESRHGIAVVLREIIEPKLEVGDFVAYVDKNDDHTAVFKYRDTMGKSLEFVYEIRKANGEVWRKIDGNWIKKEPVGDE